MNKFTRILLFSPLFLLLACSTLDQTVSKTSNVTVRDVAKESYQTFQDSYQELKTEFFPD